MAVRPPDDVLDALEKAVTAARSAGESLRFAGRDQWHLTLQFLGPVRRLAPVVAALEVVASVPAFTFGLGGAGAFPNPRRARVVWVGAAAGGPEMETLARVVRRALKPLGYEADRARFRPHLTVARMRVPGDAAPVVAAVPPGPIGPGFPVEEVVLYESRLSPKGSTYTALGRFRLG